MAAPTSTKRTKPDRHSRPRPTRTSRWKTFAPAAITLVVIAGLFIWITAKQEPGRVAFTDQIADGDTPDGWGVMSDVAGITLEFPLDFAQAVQHPLPGVTVNGYQAREGDTGILYESIYTEPGTELTIDQTVETIVSLAPNGRAVDFTMTEVNGADARRGVYTYTGQRGEEMIAWIVVAQASPDVSITLTVVDTYDGQAGDVFDHLLDTLNFSDVATPDA